MNELGGSEMQSLQIPQSSQRSQSPGRSVSVLPYLLAALLLSLVSSASWSDCACFCVAGELATLCTGVGEAQDNPNLCPDPADASCPQDSGGSTAQSFETPADGAIDCRSVRVYDAVRGEYVTTRACDVI